ncbi:MAG: amylo-alpha-1,6-glucosidase [Candidatus Auribacterota bacterium]|nr:amylo-alpha-1,6-glucosidase [Candidatus Auribacterota bacterium]
MRNNKKEILFREAYQQANRVLKKCARSRGLTASARTRGYPQIWTRDSMITLPGALLTGDPKIKESIRAGFELLARHQTPLGLIPNNVHSKTLRPNFQAYADSGLWFVVGVAEFFRRTRDKKFLRRFYPVIEKTLSWYEYQDVDRTGLITMPEGADWEDLFAVRGKGLYINVLYYLALRRAMELAEASGDSSNGEKYRRRAGGLKRKINYHFWYRGSPEEILPHLKPSLSTEAFTRLGRDSLGRKHVLPEKRILKDSSYYLPYLTFRDFGEWFDSLGNILAILSGVANKERSGIILKFIKEHKLDQPGPLKSLYPPIFPGEKDWRYYYRFNDLNLPHRYHNGGIWPFIGGFYITALVKMKRYPEAEEALVSLAGLNKKGKDDPWEFNEWFNGKTGEPMGMAEQAWSAGMYLSAFEAVRKGKFHI